MTDTSTSDSSVSAATSSEAEASTETAEESKKSETVASEGDLFRQSEIAADYVEGLLDILDYDGDIDELVSAGRPMVEVVGGRLQPLVGQRGATLEALQELTRLAIFRATAAVGHRRVPGGQAQGTGRCRPQRCREGQGARRPGTAGADVGVRAQVRARRGQRDLRRAERIRRRRTEPPDRGTGGRLTMTDPRFGAGGLGPGESSPGPSSFPGRLPRRPIAFPGRSGPRTPSPSSPSSSPPFFSVEPAGGRPPAEFVEPASRVFGDRLELAETYARMLVTDGVVRGLIGPREAPRIWERHLINCAVMSEIIPIGASVVDVGSGAGLPGIVLAVARPDLTITLVEPLARRTAFLSEAVTGLGLDATVTVVRGRAEDVVDGPPAGADLVTARAVASLDRLAGWCLPLVRTGGRLLALKGATAADEAAEHRAAIAELGGAEPVLRLCGTGLVDPPTTVVEVVKERDVVPPRPSPSGRAAATRRESGRRAGGRGSERGRTRRG